MRTQGERTKSTPHADISSRTVRSGGYLRQLFQQAENLDSHLQTSICARIRVARVEAGFTQQEMADLLGMSMRGYQNYESNRVPFRWLDKIAELTNVTAEWLLRGDPPGGPSQSEVLDRIGQLEETVEALRQTVLAALGLPEDNRVGR